MKHSEPDYEYLALALKILNGIVDQYGNIENYFNIDGGRKLNISETRNHFNKYIRSLNMSKYMEISFNQTTIARTSCKHNNENGKSELVVGLPISYRINNIEGVFNHEIGTHFLRKFNDKQQIWYKQRKKYRLQPYLATEEGLAAIN